MQRVGILVSMVVLAMAGGCAAAEPDCGLGCGYTGPAAVDAGPADAGPAPDGAFAQTPPGCWVSVDVLWDKQGQPTAALCGKCPVTNLKISALQNVCGISGGKPSDPVALLPCSNWCPQRALWDWSRDPAGMQLADEDGVAWFRPANLTEAELAARGIGVGLPAPITAEHLCITPSYVMSSAPGPMFSGDSLCDHCGMFVQSLDGFPRINAVCR